MDRKVNPLTDLFCQIPPSAHPPTKTNSLPSRAAPAPAVAAKPQTHSQGRSISTPDIHPASRDEKLRDLLERHRADRARIQRRANLTKEKSELSLRQKLQDALQEVQRIDHDFQEFRRGARAQLTMALEENASLKARLSGVLRDSNGASRSPTSVQGFHERDRALQDMKPTERELSVDRLQIVYNDSGRASTRAPDRHAVPAGVTGDGKNEAVRSNRAARTTSLRILRRLDGNLKGSAAAASATEKAKLIGSKKSHGNENSVENRRKSTKLPRSFSRKWSTCF